MKSYKSYLGLGAQLRARGETARQGLGSHNLSGLRSPDCLY